MYIPFCDLVSSLNAAMEQACQKAAALLRQNRSCEDAAASATVILEVCLISRNFLMPLVTQNISLYHSALKGIKRNMGFISVSAFSAWEDLGIVNQCASFLWVSLQDCPITNAGLGSNLTEDGRVECDASLMTGNGCFGAVGACPGT